MYKKNEKYKHPQIVIQGGATGNRWIEPAELILRTKINLAS
jgi:hypothetical protein